MKILQTIAGFGSKLGGTTTCTYDLLRYMHTEVGGDVDLLTPDVTDPMDKLAGEGEEWIKVVDNDNKTPLAISKNFKNFLEKSDYDIYHANGLWMYATHITAKIALKKKKPFVLTPHGMLYPDALARSAWRKKLMSALWFKKDIMTAACLHATCKPEVEVLRNYGYKGPIAMIPNPVPLFDYFDERNVERKLRIGFLGRLHPRKNVHGLIQAWLKLGDKVKDAELVIMGVGTPEYEAHLKALAVQFKYNNIVFKGFLQGREKYEVLASMRALCVPSDFENFGMIVTEALSVGTPVIASYGTPWEELNTEKCGWWIDATPENIASAIEKALVLDADECKVMGENGIRLVKDKYAADKVAEQMATLYEWIINGGKMPIFIE